MNMQEKLKELRRMVQVQKSRMISHGHSTVDI